MEKEISNFQYSDVIYEFRLQRKKTLNFKLNFAYLTENNIAFVNEPYKKNPDTIYTLTPNKRLVWIYNKQKIPYELKGFMIKIQNEDVEFYADEVVLFKFKEIISKKIFQARFQEEYEVIQQIGKGNYARVYSVKHRSSGKKFAVKCFEKQKLQTIEKGMLSLFNEIKIMRGIKEHPNLIKFEEAFEGENTFYLVMEIVEGISLYDEIKRHASIPYKGYEIAAILRMILEAVECIAKSNIMHRDIKSENILFAKRGSYNELKLVDFGLATFQNDYPYIFPKCGTPGFVAPEIANLEDKTKPYSVICDSFSVGVIFHILITGEAVFPGKKFNEVLKKNRACEIDFTSILYDPIDPLAKDLLMRLLAKEPENRYDATQALNHPYFSQFNKDQQLKNSQILDNINELDEQIKLKPLKLGYQQLQKQSIQASEDLHSFISHDPLFILPEPDQQEKVEVVENKMTYTIGSLDQKINNNLTLDKMLQEDLGGLVGQGVNKRENLGRGQQGGEARQKKSSFNQNGVQLFEDVIWDKTNKQ